MYIPAIGYREHITLKWVELKRCQRKVGCQSCDNINDNNIKPMKEYSFLTDWKKLNNISMIKYNYESNFWMNWFFHGLKEAEKKLICIFPLKFGIYMRVYNCKQIRIYEVKYLFKSVVVQNGSFLFLDGKEKMLLLSSLL